MKTEKIKWSRNRLLRRLARAMGIRKVVDWICAAVPWLSPGRLVRYGRLIWAKHRETTLVGRIPMIGCLMELDPNTWITRWWYIRADYESNIFLALRRFLRPGMICMDIGANAGLFTLFMAKRVGDRGKVYGYEPTAATFQLLQKNVTLNAFRNVVAENTAVTERPGTVEFHVGPSDLCVYNSIGPVVHPDAKDGQFSRVVVPATSIDEYCANHGVVRVDCVKIDVEGAEFQVLRGMRRVLEANRKIVLLIEFSRITSTACGATLDAMAQWLAAMGFRLFAVTKQGGLRALNGYIPGNEGMEMVWAARTDLSLAG